MFKKVYKGCPARSISSYFGPGPPKKRRREGMYSTDFNHCSSIFQMFLLIYFRPFFKKKRYHQMCHSLMKLVKTMFFLSGDSVNQKPAFSTHSFSEKTCRSSTFSGGLSPPESAFYSILKFFRPVDGSEIRLTNWDGAKTL